MKAILAVLLVAFVCSCAAESKMDLPPGYNTPQDIANVLANEPAAAQNVRFAATGDAPADTITFKDSGFGATSTQNGLADPDREAAESEFDPQIEELAKNIKQINTAIQESQECARRLTEQKAELRSLEEQKEHIEKEKEKKILEDKLARQMKDLAEINRMSRSLRNKFTELRRTQQLIKGRLGSTRNSLSQLESDDDVDPNEVKGNADAIAAEVDAMHAAQSRILSKAHTTNSKAVKTTLKNANDAHTREQKLLDKEAASLNQL